MLFAILTVAFVLRVGLFAVAVQRDAECMLEPDSPTYEGPAVSLLAEGRFARDPAHPDVPELHRTPGYPLFIAAVYAPAGQNRIVLCLVQMLVSLLTITMVYATGRRLAGETAGLVAGSVLALDPISIVASGLVLSETLFVVFVALILWSGVRLVSREEREGRDALALGLALAAAALVRPLGYYLALPMLLGVLTAKSFAGRPWRRQAAVGAAMLLPWVVLIGGWHARNFAVADTTEFSLIKNVDLLMYRAAGVVALRDGTTLEEAQQRLLEDLPSQAGMSQADYGEMLGERAREILTAHPLLVVRVGIAGAVRMFAGPGQASLTGYLSLAAGGTAALLLVGCSAGFLLALYLLVATGCMAALRSRRDGWAHALLLGVALYFVLVSSGPETYARFRLPIMPILAIYAGLGAAWAIRRRNL